jgi:hypothetical protein
MGMNETNSPSVSLAPNPAQESVTLQLPGTAAAGTFSIFNAAGQLVQSGTLNQNSTTLSVAALPSGYYFITVNTGETEMRSRFVVIHP